MAWNKSRETLLVRVADPDSHYFWKLDPDPDLHKSEKLDPDPQNLGPIEAENGSIEAVNAHNGGLVAQNGAQDLH
jgi:hypothetical protein